jgi:hypothetical protein
LAGKPIKAEQEYGHHRTPGHLACHSIPMFTASRDCEWKR